MTDVARFTGDIPFHYDIGLGPVLFADFAQDTAQRAAEARPLRVLELAAGTGIVTRALRDRLAPEAQIVATDLNGPMLEIAKGRFAPGEAVSFQVADACDLPFADASFDLVVCQYGIMFFPDRAKGFSEALRVLAPGGRYLATVWDAQAANPYSRLVQRTVDSFFPSDSPRFYDTPFSYHSLDRARAEIEAAGFTAFAAQVLTREKAGVDFDAFARGAVFGNPLADQIRQRGAADPEAVRTAIAKALAATFGDRLTLQTLRFEARRPPV